MSTRRVIAVLGICVIGGGLVGAAAASVVPLAPMPEPVQVPLPGKAHRPRGRGRDVPLRLMPGGARG